MREEELPEGWAKATPLDLADLVRGVSYAKGEALPAPAAGLVALLRANNIDAELEFRDLQYVPSCRVSEEQILRPGDVVVAMSSGSRAVVGKAAFLRSAWRGTFGAFCGVLRPTTLIDPTLFGLFFHTRVYRETISELSTGTNINNLKRQYFAELAFPLPPLAEQRRIIERVEALLTNVTAARARLAKVPTILKRFRQSILATACSGRLTEDWRSNAAGLSSTREALSRIGDSRMVAKTRRGVPERVDPPDDLDLLALPSTWLLISTAELLRSGALVDLKDGNHGANHPKSSEFTRDGIPFITAAQVGQYEIDYQGAPKVSGGALSRLRVGFSRPGDAILTHKGSVGRAALNTRECILTPQTTYYRCNPLVLDSRFLVYLFTSPQFYAQLASAMSQTTRDFVPISEQYRLFQVIPPIEEQHEIVRRVTALFKLAEDIERGLAEASARTDMLTQSILAKAFRGELVPTEAELARREGRSYEPASVLLDRIRKERAPSEREQRSQGTPSSAE